MPPKKRKAPNFTKTAAEAPVWTVTGSELTKAFQHIIYSLPQCHDQWFTDADWCSILPDYWSSLKNYRDQVTTKKFISAIKKHFGEVSGDRGESNPNGVYVVQHGTKHTRNWCFLITKKDFCPLPPSSPYFFVGDITKVVAPSLPNYLPVSVRDLADNIRKETYFDSPEAWKQFMPSNMPNPKDRGKSTGGEVKAMIKARMEACQTGMQHFYNVIEGGTEDDAVDVTEYKQRRITLKCHTVYAALRKALETMEDNKNRLTWVQCCDYAIEAMKVVGFEDLLSSSTVRIAQRELRDNNNKFSHPNEKARKKKAAKKEEKSAKDEDSELEEGGEDTPSD